MEDKREERVDYHLREYSKKRDAIATEIAKIRDEAIQMLKESFDCLESSLVAQTEEFEEKLEFGVKEFKSLATKKEALAAKKRKLKPALDLLFEDKSKLSSLFG